MRFIILCSGLNFKEDIKVKLQGVAIRYYYYQALFRSVEIKWFMFLSYLGSHDNC